MYEDQQKHIIRIFSNIDQLVEKSLHRLLIRFEFFCERKKLDYSKKRISCDKTQSVVVAHTLAERKAHFRQK